MAGSNWPDRPPERRRQLPKPFKPSEAKAKAEAETGKEIIIYSSSSRIDIRILTFFSSQLSSLRSCENSHAISKLRRLRLPIEPRDYDTATVNSPST